MNYVWFCINQVILIDLITVIKVNSQEIKL